MMNLIWGIVGVVMIGALYVLWPVFAQTRRRLRGPRLVRCPETSQAAEVELDAVRGAAGALLGRSTLRLHACERWKGSAALRDCEQGCLKDVTVDAAQQHGLLMSRDA